MHYIYLFQKAYEFLTKNLYFDSTCLTQYEQNARFVIKKIDIQQATKIYCIAQGTIVNILKQPIRENNLKNNRCVCVELNHLAAYMKHCKPTMLQLYI